MKLKLLPLNLSRRVIAFVFVMLCSGFYVASPSQALAFGELFEVNWEQKTFGTERCNIASSKGECACVGRISYPVFANRQYPKAADQVNAYVSDLLGRFEKSTKKCRFSRADGSPGVAQILFQVTYNSLEMVGIYIKQIQMGAPDQKEVSEQRLVFVPPLGEQAMQQAGQAGQMAAAYSHAYAGGDVVGEMRMMAEQQCGSFPGLVVDANTRKVSFLYLDEKQTGKCNESLYDSQHVDQLIRMFPAFN